MMGVNAVLWSHMLYTEKNYNGRKQRRGAEEEKGKQWGCAPAEKGAASSDVGFFFCPSHNLDFLDPLPTSEI